MSPTTECLNCGTELRTRAGTSGRPAAYCGTLCRQAAYRRRRRADTVADAGVAATVEPVPGGTAADAVVRELAQDMLEEARHLLRVLDRPDAPLLDPVEQAVNLNRAVEALTAALVGRARRGRVPWGRLGPALSMQPDTARRAFRADIVGRRIAGAKGPQAPGPAAPPPRPPAPEAATAANRSRSHLAPVLSRLQRASRMPLRALAARLGIDPSQASRILSGERFPSWHLTERFARACGADPMVLRKVWEDEKLREDQPSDRAGRPAADDDPAERLRIALHTLHVKAGYPAPDVLAEATRHTLRPKDISAALDGNLPYWPLLADLVQALGGDPAYFRPLWETATGHLPAAPHRPATAPVTAPATAPPPGPPLALPAQLPPSGERLVDLLQAFGPVLATAPRR
ncbi:helix-turn-helix domain-containing protein [Streptomyces sp. CA-111067]|uniref:helix-turn-helix domain-containing protein n=1 Tax=Streptomyces sp. CA-111067 TaxID=3240046 RepID=UPI003D976681